ncbi:hypothetical protein L9G74_21335, partial [Shewanella sp. C32]
LPFVFFFVAVIAVAAAQENAGLFNTLYDAVFGDKTLSQVLISFVQKAITLLTSLSNRLTSGSGAENRLSFQGPRYNGPR